MKYLEYCPNCKCEEIIEPSSRRGRTDGEVIKRCMDSMGFGTPIHFVRCTCGDLKGNAILRHGDKDDIWVGKDRIKMYYKWIKEKENE